MDKSKIPTTCFACKVCQRIFLEEKLFLRHKRTFHSTENSNSVHHEHVQGQNHDLRSYPMRLIERVNTSPANSQLSNTDELEVLDIYGKPSFKADQSPLLYHHVFDQNGDQMQKNSCQGTDPDREQVALKNQSLLKLEPHHPPLKKSKNLILTHPDIEINPRRDDEIRVESNISSTNCESSKHMCQICGRMWSSGKTLNVHMRSHVGQIHFPCTECKKIFSTAGNHKKHMEAVHDERAFGCNFCKKTFLEQKNLTVHMAKDHLHVNGDDSKKTKVDAKDAVKILYECRFCRKKLKCRDYLTIHERTHTRETPFNCRYCSKAFICYDYRTIHERTHTGEKPYQCGHCHLRFTTRCSANRHVRSKHPLNP